MKIGKRVKVHSGVDNSGDYIMGIVFMLCFQGGALLLMSKFFVNGVFSFRLLLSNSALAVVAFLFFAVGVHLFFGLLKKPRAFKAKLTSIDEKMYKKKAYYYLEFGVPLNEIRAGGFSAEDKVTGEKMGQTNLPKMKKYACYAPPRIDFKIGNEYVLGIKELNDTPRYVGEMTTDIVNGSGGELTVKALYGVLYMICLIAWIGFMSSILCIIMMPSYRLYFIFSAIGSGFLVALLYQVINYFKKD